MTLPLVQLVDIPQRGDSRGGLSVAELGGALPFPVRRVYWIHGTKPGVSRDSTPTRSSASSASVWPVPSA
jgi:hypothetical protein